MENVKNAINPPDLSLLKEDFAHDVSGVVRVILKNQKPTMANGTTPMLPSKALVEAEMNADRKAYENYQKFMEGLLIRRNLKNEHKQIIIFGTGGDHQNQNFMDFMYPVTKKEAHPFLNDQPSEPPKNESTPSGDSSS